MTKYLIPLEEGENMHIEQNISKLLLKNRNIEEWKSFSIHYKIRIRDNYKKALEMRIKRQLRQEGE